MQMYGIPLLIAPGRYFVHTKGDKLKTFYSPGRDGVAAMEGPDVDM